MRLQIRRRILCLLIAALLGAPGAVLVVDVAHSKEKPKKPKTRRVQSVREVAGKKLTKALEALKENDYATATSEMNALKKKKSLNDHEQALMWQMFGYIESGQDDYESAAESFEKCVALDALPEVAQRSTQYNLAQLYLATENYDKAIETLLAWFNSTPDPSSEAYYMLAIGYLQQGDQEKALVPAKKAVELAKQPKEPWLQLLLSLQFERKSYREVLDILEQLIAYFPKKSYWLQLSGVYAELGEEENSLAAMQLAYSQGLLTKERELLSLARRYLYHQIPYRAARVVEDGMRDGLIESNEKSWQLLADSWIHAREYEKGLEPLTEAAQLAEDGDIYIRLGQVHMEREDWDQAKRAFNAGIKKGKLSNEGSAHLLNGIALASSNDRAGAAVAFKKASQFPKQKKPAEQWLQHLKRQ